MTTAGRAAKSARPAAQPGIAQKPQASSKSQNRPGPVQPAARSLPSPPAPGLSLPESGTVRDGAGFLLALLAWGWLVMPFLENGVPGVKKVLMAKFLNREPDGGWLD